MKKIKFYRALVLEIIETLIGICLTLERFSPYGRTLRGHERALSMMSKTLREKMEKKKKDGGYKANQFFVDEFIKE